MDDVSCGGSGDPLASMNVRFDKKGPISLQKNYQLVRRAISKDKSQAPFSSISSEASLAASRMTLRLSRQ